MRGLIVTFVLVGVLIGGLGVPLLLGRVPPNPWYGFRVRATVQAPDVWYPVNAYTGRLLLTTGIILGFAAVGIPATARLSPQVYALLMTALLFVGVLI